MKANSFPRLRSWQRFIRFWDSVWVLGRIHVSLALERASDALGNPDSSSKRKPRRVQLELDPLETRSHPGQTVGAGMLSFGVVGTGLAMIDRALASTATGATLDDPRVTTARHARLEPDSRWDSLSRSSSGLSDVSWDSAQHQAAVDGSGASRFSSPLVGQEQAQFPGALMGEGQGRGAQADPLADPFVDVLTGESLRPKPPIRIVDDGLGRHHAYADDMGGGAGGKAPGGYGAGTETSAPLLSPSTTFNLDGSPRAGGQSPGLLPPKAQNGPVGLGLPVRRAGPPPLPVHPGGPPVQPGPAGPVKRRPPGHAGPNIGNIDPHGGLGQFQAILESFVGDPQQATNTPLPMLVPAWQFIDPYIGSPPPRPPVPVSAASDPTAGTLSVQAAGTIPSYSNHQGNPADHGLPNPASLGSDAGAANPTPALVYASNTVNALPIIQVAYRTATVNDLHPNATDHVVATLTWNGTAQTALTFYSPGTGTYNLAMDLQAPGPVTTTGYYPYSVELKAYDVNNTLQNDSTFNSNFAVVVNNSTSAGGYGWSIGGVDKLVAVTGGQLWVYGSGGTRFFATGTGSTYTSPANDFGALVKNGDNSYTYTAKDQTKWNFNTSGTLTKVVDAHNLALTYSYSGGNLSTIQDPNGDLTSFAYSGSTLSTITKPGNLVTTLTTNGASNLTNVANPDGSLLTLAYDGANRIISEKAGQLTTSFAYDPLHSVLDSLTQGGTALAITPANIQGFATTPATLSVNAVGVINDGLSQSTSFTLDGSGRLLQLATPDGANPAWSRNSAGLTTKVTDMLNQVTTLGYSSTGGDLTSSTRPDGSQVSYAYDATYHKLTQFQDSLNDLTTYGYNASGDLVTVKNALNQVTTIAWSSGLEQSVTDPLGHATTYLYDNSRHLIATQDALGGLTSYGYDGART